MKFLCIGIEDIGFRAGLLRSCLRNSLVCTDKKNKLSHGCSNMKSAVALFISFHSFLK